MVLVGAAETRQNLTELGAARFGSSIRLCRHVFRAGGESIER